MLPANVNKSAALWSGLLVNVFSWGIIWMAASGVSDVYAAINDRVDLVKINIVELWVPIGFIGVGLFSLASPSVAFFTGKKSDYVWGNKGRAIANYVMLFFAIIGVFSAIYFYQSMTAKLEAEGYVYCRPLTKFSATGRHEAYVARPELCVKPSKIP
ncbi:MAG: hypothetical protein ACRCUH_09850 [Shewanella sp.]